MKVYSRPLNDGEMFCTSIKAAKSVFQNTEVKLCFGEFGRQYNPYKNEFGYGYYKKNIKRKHLSLWEIAESRNTCTCTSNTNYL